MRVAKQTAFTIFTSAMLAACVTTPDDKCGQPYMLYISSNNEIYSNEHVLGLTELSELADQWFMDCPNAQVEVVASPNSTSRFLVDVVNILRNSGLLDVAISTDSA